MPYAKKIVLHTPQGYLPRLNSLIEDFIRERVIFVAVVGKDASKVEDIIDELIVGDASDDSREILTSFHTEETVEEVVQFARSLTGQFAGDVQVVELG
jgi:hypothetical protein